MNGPAIFMLTEYDIDRSEVEIPTLLQREFYQPMKCKGTLSRFPSKVNRPGLSPFPKRQIPPSSKLDVELGVEENNMVSKKRALNQSI